VRFVSGEGNWNNQVASYPATEATSGEAKVGAGTLAYKTAQPMNATFEYVLVSTDGKRSAPFQRTFNILPPIVISSVTAPRPLGVGRAFNVDIKYQKGAATSCRSSVASSTATCRGPTFFATAAVQLATRQVRSFRSMPPNSRCAARWIRAGRCPGAQRTRT
jgi:hypothetical protein